ncbi:MAG: class I SAM-dependent methyltransferase [Sphingobacteriales bacterium]|nr:MAG: class I SAM-dependent methyltransferase [Sphingobacteriales bacterium]
MALKQHKDKQVQYDQQVDNSRNYVLPFIEKTKKIGPGIRVLEIGCGEGGVLTPFIEGGCYCVGVDLDQYRIDLANKFLLQAVADEKAAFFNWNVYDDSFLQKYKNYFDLIILKDTIEHIPNQEAFIPYMKQLLRQDGQIFFGFPPWYMPFGGHQQIAENKLASKMPYYHILPKPIYMKLLKWLGEDEGMLQELSEVYDTRITIERFEKIIKASGLIVFNQQHYLINPIYKYKFGLEPRKQSGVISAIPFVRNFLTTCVYYTVG